jgi:hypothetical protein
LPMHPSSRLDTWRHTLQCRLHQLHVMAIGAFYYQPDRDARSLSQQTSLDAAFGAVAWIGAGFFPHPAAL